MRILNTYYVFDMGVDNYQHKKYNLYYIKKSLVGGENEL